MKIGPLLLGALLLSASILAQPAVAGASYDPLASGTTKLTLDPGFAHLLASNGVRLTAAHGATHRSRSYILPVTGGRLDPIAGQGEVDTDATLVFQRGSRKVPLRHIAVRPERQPLIAKVGGGQLKLARAEKVTFTRQGFGSLIAARGLKLTPKLATRLSKKLRLRGVFVAGQAFGVLSAASQPATVAILPQGRATITPSPSFLAKLNELFVSVNPIAPAERTNGPLFTLPIIPAGALAPNAASGTLRTGGSLEFLQLGAGQIFWHELWFEPAAGSVLAEVDEEPAPPFAGKLDQVSITSLGAGVADADPGTRKISLNGAPLALNAAMAAAFNEAFAKPQGKSDVFQSGEPVGTLSFQAQTQ
jgi:hypothetical protein